MLGFDLRLKKEKNENQPEEKKKNEPAEFVPTVVEVRFADGRQYPYYNDKFDLKVNDVVFVDGKLFGKPGRVISVTTKFKISLEYYKKVLSVLDLSFRGTYKNEQCFMVSQNSTLSFKQVKEWYYPPKESEEEFICGEGETIQLNNFESFDADAIDGAEELIDEDKVSFISCKNGIRHAIIVGGKEPHTVDFKIKNNALTDVYCDCITPCSCKHIAAVAMILSFMYKKKALNVEDDFTIISKKLFYSLISFNNDTITL